MSPRLFARRAHLAPPAANLMIKQSFTCLALLARLLLCSTYHTFQSSLSCDSASHQEGAVGAEVGQVATRSGRCSALREDGKNNYELRSCVRANPA
eukprot:m.65682 g.65682  ORF g.65682 m.65682 type:complete len:96 (+) comp7582_c0_seq2:3330-3617(+)